MRVLLPLYSQTVPTTPSGSTLLYAEESRSVRTLASLKEAGFRQLSIHIENSHAGTLQILTRRAPGESYVVFVEVPMTAFSSSNQNMFHMDLEGIAEIEVNWLNGASAQTTWKVTMEVGDVHGGFATCD